MIVLVGSVFGGTAVLVRRRAANQCIIHKSLAASNAGVPIEQKHATSRATRLRNVSSSC